MHHVNNRYITGMHDVNFRCNISQYCFVEETQQPYLFGSKSCVQDSRQVTLTKTDLFKKNINNWRVSYLQTFSCTVNTLVNPVKIKLISCSWTNGSADWLTLTFFVFACCQLSGRSLILRAGVTGRCPKQTYQILKTTRHLETNT